MHRSEYYCKTIKITIKTKHTWTNICPLAVDIAIAVYTMQPAGVCGFANCQLSNIKSLPKR